MKTMLEVCEPVFVAVCQLNRSRMINPNVDANKAIADLRAALESAQREAENENIHEFMPEDKAASSFDLRSIGVHRTLCHLIDDTAMRFPGALRERWRTPFSIELYGDQGWADLFFDHVDCLLKSAPESTIGRRQVMLRALELGFLGSMRRDAQGLAERMSSLRDSLASDAPGRTILTEKVGRDHPIEERTMEPPPAVTLKRWAATVVAMGIIVLVAYVGTYLVARGQLAAAVNQLDQALPKTTEASTSAATAPATAPAAK